MPKEGFIWSEEREPHLDRRKKILQDHPEIRSLFGIDRRLKYKALFACLLQLAIPFFLPENIWAFLAVCLIFGATLSHVLFLAIHEITHDLAYPKTVQNNWLAMMVNLPLVFPYAMAFKLYHAKHHWQQGEDGIDTDIPSEFEAKMFKGILGKFVWLIHQILFYALRPVMVYPVKPDRWQLINIVVQLGFIVVYLPLIGWWGILYLLLSMLFAGGLHPISGHFIAEHYVVVPGQETYSYYGWLNKLTFNVGYHNEHHDFPKVPGSKLPAVRKIAKEHYDSLYYYKSWSSILWKFVVDPNMRLTSRVKRKTMLIPSQQNQNQ
ncbi:MAG: fatty acid desaturase [Cyclobacteriaceae bacterium]